MTKESKAQVSRLRRIWNDPVGSKVIAQLIIYIPAALVAVVYFATQNEFLSAATQVKNYLIVGGIFIIIGSIVAFFATLLRAILQKRRSPRKSEPAQADVSPIVDHDAIERVSVSVVPVQFEAGEARIKTEADASEDPIRVITAKFHLKARPAIKAKTVRAALTIESDIEEAIFFRHVGVWLNNAKDYQRIEPGGFAQLILGIYRNEDLFACEREYVSNIARSRPILGSKALITVELIVVKDGSSVEFVKEFFYLVELDPEFSFKPLAAAEGERITNRPRPVQASSDADPTPTESV